MKDKYHVMIDDQPDRFDRLPRACALLKEKTKWVILRRGESGYYDAPEDFNGFRFNESRGITRAQIKAMEAGSLWGFECLAADPKRHE